MSNFLSINRQIIEDNFSKERFATYMNLSNNNELEAKRLYLANVEASKLLHSMIAEFEVVLRNQIDKKLSDVAGNGWIFKQESLLCKRHIADVLKIKNMFFLKGKIVTKSDVISGVTLGFWVSLFSKDYDKTLWRAGLCKLFKHSPHKISRNFIRLELEKCRNLRNRIAHCECILKYPIKEYTESIINLVSWIEPKLKPWFEEIARESI